MGADPVAVGLVADRAVAVVARMVAAVAAGAVARVAADRTVVGRAVVAGAVTGTVAAGAAVGMVAGEAAGVARPIPITGMDMGTDIPFTVIRDIMVIRMADILAAGVGVAGKAL